MEGTNTVAANSGNWHCEIQVELPLELLSHHRGFHINKSALPCLYGQAWYYVAIAHNQVMVWVVCLAKPELWNVAMDNNVMAELSA